jgi:hypothetical protein
LITNRDVVRQLTEALEVLSGSSHPVSKVSIAGDILTDLRAELYGYETCKPYEPCEPEPCEPCPPCEPEPECCDDDDDCYEDCDDDGYVWIYVPKDYAVTLTPCE